MRDITVLAAALGIIEGRIREPMNAADLAAACFMSYSGLQKLFGYALGCSVSEYITKRRLSLASRELLSSDRSITDIAPDYQYNSPEAFSRAFKRFWGISPGMFRKTRRFTELQPKFKIEKGNGGFTMSTRKPLDVSELYDELKRLGGTYVLSIDIAGFAQINERCGYAAGDAVLAKTCARLEEETSGDMLLFRIGGDEFAVVTGYASPADAEALARKIAEKNGDPVAFDGQEIPLTLRIGVSQIPTGGLSYQKALNDLAQAVEKTRKTGDYVVVYTKDDEQL
jgi:AraC family transcriptional regulator